MRTKIASIILGLGFSTNRRFALVSREVMEKYASVLAREINGYGGKVRRMIFDGLYSDRNSRTYEDKITFYCNYRKNKSAPMWTEALLLANSLLIFNFSIEE